MLPLLAKLHASVVHPNPNTFNPKSKGNRQKEDKRHEKEIHNHNSYKSYIHHIETFPFPPQGKKKKKQTEKLLSSAFGV